MGLTLLENERKNDWYAIHNENTPSRLEVSLLHRWGFPSGGAILIRFSNDGEYVAVGLWITVQLYKVRTGQRIGNYVHNKEEDVPSPLGTFCFGADNQSVVTATAATVWIWDIQKGIVITKFEGPKSTISRLRVSSDGRYLASRSENGAVHIWDWKSQETLFKLSLGGPLEFSSDSKFLFVGTGSDEIVLLDSKTGAEIARFNNLLDGDAIEQIAVSTCGTYLTLSSSHMAKRYRLGHSENSSERRGEREANGLWMLECTHTISMSARETLATRTACNCYPISYRQSEIIVHNLIDQQPQFALVFRNNIDFIGELPCYSNTNATGHTVWYGPENEDFLFATEDSVDGYGHSNVWIWNCRISEP